MNLGGGGRCGEDQTDLTLLYGKSLLINLQLDRQRRPFATTTK